MASACERLVVTPPPAWVACTACWRRNAGEAALATLCPAAPKRTVAAFIPEKAIELMEFIGGLSPGLSAAWSVNLRLFSCLFQPAASTNRQELDPVSVG